MSYVPLNIDLRGRSILIVGGGRVALRKAKALLNSGARIHVVAPAVCPALKELETSGTIVITEAPYTSEHLTDVFLAVAATSRPEVNREVSSDARSLNILVSVVDAPELSDCIFPAVLRRNNLTLAVSTNGTCPSFAAEIRNHLAKTIGEEYGELLKLLAEEREKLLTESSDSTYNGQVLQARTIQLLQELIHTKERVP